jgi:adenosylcobinamide kinase/adenosylcobinamide-phosphate guanylyltransferase
LNITFIIGGARSGKSAFALKEAMMVEGRKAYIATAEALDEEMRERIEKHKAERGSDWETREVPLKISEVLLSMKDTYGVVLLDCLTIWLSNILIRTQSTEPRTQTIEKGTENKETQRAEEDIQELIAVLKGSGLCALYIVSNEVGSGIVPENKLARRFRDLAGTLNRKVAEIADEVYLVTAGIPVKIK